ncbi:disintegrin and metalloproteinase domain-containing protein 8a [Erpetoichthys calabaricus]|uniref:disintegrin and metalloproteinase domain-containing protein 8a n=1 Tax=Erpetoichthys calabaricus TaxID=27687 RepID=UPI002234D88F|nr:disintegrin and metalloproteinase domain-containing protein 8a [Erpetoichthys calabaricus]
MRWIVLTGCLGIYLYLLTYAAGTNGNPHLAHVEKYEVTTLHRLTKTKRDASSAENPYPEKMRYALRIEGKNYTVHLQKNRNLLSKDYTETYYLPDGTEVTRSPDSKEHCFYQGHIVGVKGSSVSVSLCQGMSGLLIAEQQNAFLIEPLIGAKDGEHAVYRQEHLRMKRATCGDSNITFYDQEPKLSSIFKPQYSKSSGLDKAKKYVEMYLVADKAEYAKFKMDFNKVRNRMLEVVNHVDKLYRTVNIRVVLVGLEVWQNDKIVVNRDPDITLNNFLSWRKSELLPRKKHDNAQFVTGVNFEGSTVGLATKFAMCLGDSGAVNEDHHDSPLGVASTIAHEMGHNLGMSHDQAQCYCQHKGCIMADKVGSDFPSTFSSCSYNELQQFLIQYSPTCLLNAPNSDELYGGPVCGNEFVEKGEECDCGSPEECKNPCCNATTCRLKEGVQCAHGECCQDCKIKAAGDMCRPSSGDCDLPEYCNGESPLCPENAFQMNGNPCKSGQGYCFNGECPTHQQHCITLWGPGARVASNSCFQQNILGNKNLHCKRTSTGYQRCDPEDVKCGKIHCVGGNVYPITNSKYIQTIGYAGEIKCNVATSNDLEDPGLVPTGTKCGDNKVCSNSKCVSLDIDRIKGCSDKCNNRGVCNHKMECHCDAGWAPPYCDIKLVNVAKSPVNLIIYISIAVALIIMFLLIAGFLVYRKQSPKITYPCKKNVKSACNSGLTNPLFHDSQNKGKPQVSTPEISRPVFVEASSLPEECRPLQVTVIPSRLPPEPPKSQLSHKSTNTNSGGQIVKPNMPPPVPPAKPNSSEKKPSPPTKPLPTLKPKTSSKPNPCPPVPPVKPSVVSHQWNQTQAGTRPKVALLPPSHPR